MTNPWDEEPTLKAGKDMRTRLATLARDDLKWMDVRLGKLAQHFEEGGECRGKLEAAREVVQETWLLWGQA